ncbi:hypothetical protein B0H17DRAFT_454863 [Mycena rosella]|uniref:Uncharacterized protein n=1 Tax=Mycena rosella TaxID=1033263 RepID=A0AAD7GYX9_MYCRO|nr:hypothetical protein B0H17DRAFT_454863 [Mycena rosella]
MSQDSAALSLLSLSIAASNAQPILLPDPGAANGSASRHPQAQSHHRRLSSTGRRRRLSDARDAAVRPSSAGLSMAALSLSSSASPPPPAVSMPASAPAKSSTPIPIAHAAAGRNKKRGVDHKCESCSKAHFVCVTHLCLVVPLSPTIPLLPAPIDNFPLIYPSTALPSFIPPQLRPLIPAAARLSSRLPLPCFPPIYFILFYIFILIPATHSTFLPLPPPPRISPDVQPPRLAFAPSSILPSLLPLSCLAPCPILALVPPSPFQIHYSLGVPSFLFTFKFPLFPPLRSLFGTSPSSIALWAPPS